MMAHSEVIHMDGERPNRILNFGEGRVYVAEITGAQSFGEPQGESARRLVDG
jgi:hypothetical protein